MSDGTHIDIVNNTLSQLSAQTADADAAVTNAIATMEDLASQAAILVDLSGITYDLDLSDWSSSFTTVTVPSEPNIDGEIPTVPALTDITAVSAIDKGTAPTDTLSLAGKPGTFPTSLLTSLPELTALSLPAFTSNVPADSIGKLVATYSYTEPTYTELVKDEAQAQILSVLNGNLVISTAVWDALWDRAAADIAIVQVADEWQASNLASSLSMTGMVSEALTQRLDQAQQRAIDNLSKVRLEQSIQEANQRREDLWEGLKQGIAFEAMWLGHHEAVAGRALATAAKAHEALVAVYNANVSWFNNVILQRVAQSVASGRLELDVALAPLQEFSSRLQTSQVELAQDDETVKRWLAKWDGYRIDKEAARMALGERVRSYSAKVNAEAQRHAGDVANWNLQLAEGNRDISLYQAKWQGVGTKAAAISSRFDALINNARMTIENQQAKLGFENMELHKALESAMRGPLIEIDKARVSVENTLRVLEHIATLQVGLAQAYLSASDISLGVSASADADYNYSGDA